MKYIYKIHDKLYDLSDFVKIHPGGIDVFNNLKDYTNITAMIYTYHKNPKKNLAMLPEYNIPFTDNIIIKYDTNYTYDSYCELKKLVYNEIYKKKIPLYWSNKEITYNAFMLSMYLGIWSYCFLNAKDLSYWWMVLLAIMNTGWGILVFHETSHYCGFKNQIYNQFISQYFPFTNMNYWKYHHNYLHHSFTNTDYDYDFNPGKLLRYSNSCKLKYIHKYQYILYIMVLFFATFTKHAYFTLRHSNFIFITILIYFFKIKVYIFYSLISSIFAIIANLSHIQYECIQINTENKNDFLYNQVSSSMNYKTDDPITRFICLGLDIQIEHHLFPNIPHSSLRQIQHIVRDYCDKNDIPYIENPSIFPTIYSYICYLYNMGNP
jgi:linoleoyl-CoA desaturase